MTPEFEQALIASGARLYEGGILDFGDPAAELRAAESQAIVVPLTMFSMLEFSGEDAEPFLHGQLSCEVKGVTPGGATYGAYCSPQGRMLASLILLRLESSFLMLLPASIAEVIRKRIGMFVLRSKVKIVRAEQVLLGLSGGDVQPDPAGTNAASSDAMRWSCKPGGDIRVQLSVGSAGRVLLAVPQGMAAARWQALAQRFRPAGTSCWEWLDIRAGIPWIGAETREEFIPQMANVDLIGGVSFSKGCYPGQEVVARTQFRGQVKRRMFLAHVDAASAPHAGDALFSDDLGDRGSGKVVSANAAPSGGYDLLAVVSVASKDASTVRLGSNAGPALQFRNLPYPVP